MTDRVPAAGPGPVTNPPRALLPNDAWHGWFGMYDHLAAVTIAVLPVVALAVWVLARRRRSAGVAPAWATRTAATEVGLVYAMLPALWLTMDPGARAGSVSGAVSLVPLQDLPHMGTFQAVGNLLLLAVPGLLAPLRFAAVASLPRILVAAAVVSASIETAQYVLMLDRVSSIDDVLLNTIGAGLAALASRRWWRDARVRGVARSGRSTGHGGPQGSTQNSFPSGSAMTTSSPSARMTRPPSATSLSTSASTGPMARRSKCWRFLAVFGSGTRRNHRLGPPQPAGSTQARSAVLSSSTFEPRAAAQNAASARASVQSNVTDFT